MPNHFQEHTKQELLNLTRSLKQTIVSRQLFDEDEFQVSATSSQIKISEQPSVVQTSSAKKQNLENLYRLYENCQVCPLGSTRNKIVFGMGSSNPKVLFVGEGPGFEEDRKGLPFVGKAGMLLDKIMASIGLNRESVYIANIVKCHPMKNPSQPLMRGNDRPPSPEEVEACSPILARQIEILDPPFICALGSPAAKVLLNTQEGITKLRGKVFDFKIPGTNKIIPLLPTYHPAALLRNEDLKKDVWSDMKLLRSLIKQR